MKKIVSYIIPLLILIILLIFVINKCNNETIKKSWYEVYMNISEGKKILGNKEVKVAIIDSGISENMLHNYDIINTYNAVNNTNNVSDTNGHGTELVSILKHTNISNKMNCIAPQCKLIIIKVMDEDNLIKIDYVCNAIEHAIKKEVDIINISLGINTSSIKLQEYINKETTEGIIIVAALKIAVKTAVMIYGNYVFGKALYMIGYGIVKGQSYTRFKFGSIKVSY